MKTSRQKFARSTIGHSSVADRRERWRVLDGYATPPVAVEALLRVEQLNKNIWEPANGFGDISTTLKKHRHTTFTSDVHRWHKSTEYVVDFRACKNLPKRFRNGCDIITNPPFVLALEFAQTALKLLPRGFKLCLLLRLQWLEGIKRFEFFKQNPPRIVHVFSWRIPRMHRFGYKGKNGGTTMAFAWFVWEKSYRGPTELGWIGKEN
jgi:hypothetical protein